MDNNETETLSPGTAFGRYVIQRLLGVGGMGAVYEATHTDLNKRVAVKTLHRNIALNPEANTRFLREGRAASAIQHPHVVDVFDVGVANGLPYLVMEYLEGEDLAALIARAGPLSVEQTADVLIPVIAAVGSAHEAGVVHRDLKPENIFLTKTRQRGTVPKVLDFGISKLSSDSQAGMNLTSTSALLGTPFYMSPEQAKGGKHVDARSDQYALGVILYECVTKRRPFDGDGLYDILHSIVMGTFQPPRTVRGDLPEAFEALILRAMARTADQRFDSVQSLGRALLPFASRKVQGEWDAMFGSGQGSLRPAPAGPGPGPSPERAAAPTMSPSSITATGGQVQIPSATAGGTISQAALELSSLGITHSPQRSRTVWFVVGGVVLLAAIGGAVGLSVGRSRSTVAPEVHATTHPTTSGTPFVATTTPQVPPTTALPSTNPPGPTLPGETAAAGRPQGETRDAGAAGVPSPTGETAGEEAMVAHHNTHHLQHATEPGHTDRQHGGRSGEHPGAQSSPHGGHGSTPSGGGYTVE
jgi:serine/threonine-protein kinase